MSTELWSWAGLAGLGAVHGINPAMGWLFAVALGLQEKRGRAVWRALGPLAAGHALAIGSAVAVAGMLGHLLDPRLIRWLVAALLLGLGTYRLVRHRHPRLAGMRVGPGQLTAWSFLMASAHGAGLMVLPLVLGGTLSSAGMGAGHAAHGAHTAPLAAGVTTGSSVALLVTLVHTAGYLLVTGGVAWLVYEKLGVRLLRTAWINIDVLWAIALVITALATPFL